MRKVWKAKREKKRKNIIIKKVETKDGNKREAVEELLKRIDVKVEITKIRRIEMGIEEKRSETWKRGPKVGNNGKKEKFKRKKKKNP